jgi:hypothetical protein
MKSLAILGSAIWIMAFAALNTIALAEARAESLEVQCRAAARAELKGPDCRMVMPPNPTSSCNIPTQTEVRDDSSPGSPFCVAAGHQGPTPIFGAVA